MRYVGIASPCRAGGRAYCARRLVDVDERAADEEERRDDGAREERRDGDRLTAAAVQEREEQALRQEDDERDRAQRAERVHVVRPPEHDAAAERLAQRQLLDQRDRYGESD